MSRTRVASTALIFRWVCVAVRNNSLHSTLICNLLYYIWGIFFHQLECRFVSFSSWHIHYSSSERRSRLRAKIFQPRFAVAGTAMGPLSRDTCHAPERRRAARSSSTLPSKSRSFRGDACGFEHGNRSILYLLPHYRSYSCIPTYSRSSSFTSLQTHADTHSRLVSLLTLF